MLFYALVSCRVEHCPGPRRVLPRTLGVGRSWPAGTALTARCVIVLQIGQAFQNKTQLAMTKLEVKKTGHKAVKGCVSAPPLSPPNAVLGALAGPFAHFRSDYSLALSWAVQFDGVLMCQSFC